MRRCDTGASRRVGQLGAACIFVAYGWSIPLTAVTFLLRLPFDIGAPAGATIEIYSSRESGVVAFPSSTSVPDGYVVSTRLVFRHSAGDQDRGKPARLEPFEDFFEGLPIDVDEVGAAGLSGTDSLSVVAATVMGDVRLSAATAADDEQQLTRLFDRCLAGLNTFLTMYGFLKGNPGIGSIRRTELPPFVPVVIDPLSSADPVNRRGVLNTLQVGSFEDDRPFAEDDFVFAHTLLDHAQTGWRYRLPIELLHRAHREFYSGVYDEGVISLGTAVEAVVTTTLGAVHVARGASASATERLLQAGFANLVRDHLAPLFRELGEDATVVDDWLADCYGLRNAAAHRGEVPDHGSALAAYRATIQLVGGIADALRGSTDYRAIGDELPVRRVSQEELGRLELGRLTR